MKKWLWVIPAVVAIAIGVGMCWYFMTDWTTTVGICYRDATNESNREYRRDLESALEDMGYEVLTADSDNDQARQLEQIEQLADRTCQMLILEPVMTSASQELMAKIQEVNIPVVLTGPEPETDISAWQNIAYVGYDGAVPGILQAQMILDLPDRGDLNGDGVISCLILQGPEDDLDEMTHMESGKKALKLGPLGVDVLSVSCGEKDQTSGFRRTAGELSRFGKDVEVIFCSQDTLAMGAIEAIADGGLQAGTDVYVVSAGGTAEGLEAVRAGKLAGTVIDAGDQKLQTLLQIVQAMMEQRPVESYYYLDYTAVTAENVQAFSGE